jgi:non-ribosomal peptide synthetase component F
LYKRQELPHLMLRYKDFSEWHSTGPVKAALKQQENYWLKEFAGEIPVLNLPTDFPRPVKKDYKGSSFTSRIEKKHTSLLKALAIKENTTLFAVLFSIYNVFLWKISRQRDIIVGTPVAGRRHADLDHIIGMFVNTLPLRNCIEEEQTFKDFLNQVKKRTLVAFENQDYPFEDLVNQVIKNRDMGRNPLFDVFFTFTHPDLKHLGQTISPGEADAAPEVNAAIAEAELSMFDLFLFGAELEEEIFLGLIYSAGLFKPETIERFINYFREIVSAVVEDDGIGLKDIKISHRLGVAKSGVFRDEDEEFSF